MKIRAFNMAVAALSVLVVPTIAAAQPVATPLTQPAPEAAGAGAAASGEGFIMLGLAVVAAGLGVYTAADGGNNSNNAAPVSP